MRKTATYRKTSFSQIQRLSYIIIMMTIFIVSVSGYKMALASSPVPSYERGYTISYNSVVVQNGDTLWSLAAKSDLNQDVYFIVQKIMQYNSLSSTYIHPGQELYIPTRL